jgi:hypothetical protein
MLSVELEGEDADELQSAAEALAQEISTVVKGHECPAGVTCDREVVITDPEDESLEDDDGEEGDEEPDSP